MIFSLGICLSSVQQSMSSDSIEETRLLEQAKKSEINGSYGRAASFYAEYLRRNRDDSNANDSFNRMNRLAQQNIRLQDQHYRKLIVAIRPSQVIDLCIHIAEILSNSYVEVDRARPEILFQHAMDEVIPLLKNPSYLEPILGTLNTDAAKIIEIRINQLRKQPILNLAELRETLMELNGEIRNSAWSENTTRACNLILLECAHGACQGLDQFTLLFTPSQKAILDSAFAGRQPGVGLNVVFSNGHYEVSRVLSGSSAEEAGLLRGDLIFSLQGIPATMMTQAQVNALMTSPAGQEIEMQVQPQGMSTITDLKLRSKMIVIPSVDWDVIGPTAAEVIGLVRVSSFKESTTNEFREALARLQTVGVRGLIIDLRGNPGGAFKSALGSADLFLDSGIIVQSEGQVKEFNKSFASSGSNPFALPVVIMVDEDTASSAEILAGALQQHGKAKIVGNRTRGKGSVQCLIPVDKAPWDKLPGGVQLTVAKLKLPTGQTFERGLLPDVRVEGDSNAVFTAAKLELFRLIAKAVEGGTSATVPLK